MQPEGKPWELAQSVSCGGSAENVTAALSLTLSLLGRFPLRAYSCYWFWIPGFSLILHLIAQLVTLSITACLSSVMAMSSLCTACCGTIRRKLASTFPATGKTSEILQRKELLMGNGYLEMLSEAFVIIAKIIMAEKSYIWKLLSWWQGVIGSTCDIFAHFTANLLCKCTAVLFFVKSVL